MNKRRLYLIHKGAPCEKKKQLFPSPLIAQSIQFAFHLSVHVKIRSKIVYYLKNLAQVNNDNNNNNNDDDDDDDDDDKLTINVIFKI